MKILKLLTLILFIGLAKNSFAQEASSVKLSAEYPEAGKKLAITYSPGDGVLKGKTGLSAKIYYIDKDFPAEEATLTQDGKKWTGSITIPDSAKAFLIKFKSNDALVDSNGGKGFIYLIYKDKKPVPGAYAGKAMIYTFHQTFNIEDNSEQSIADYKKEFELYPASERENKENYYSLMAHGDDADRAYINKKINDFKGSDYETDYEAILVVLRATGKAGKADSLKKVAEAKFPKGELVASELFSAAYHEADLKRKDSIYNAYIKIAPPNDYMTFQLCIAYLKDGQYDKYEFYKTKLKDTTDIANTLNGAAYDMAKQKHLLPTADKIAAEAVAMLKYRVEHPQARGFATIEEDKAGSQKDYDYAAETYNFVIYNEGRYEEAAKAQEPIFVKYPDDLDVLRDYALMLVALKQYDKASDIIVAALKRGKTSDDLNITLKQAYIGKNGSDKGFDAYMAPLNEIAKKKALDALAKTMINDPAPLFALKDLDGNNVSLAELKGKTVIVDFWATWCGPCKASMPGMQLAVTKYKDDPNVKFLFIDTWENGDNFVPGVKKFIGDNKYTFRVLLDEKDKTGAQAKVVSAFKVDGIPTKFIIDKKGNIRFKYVGYDGTADQLVAEVSNMIELAN